MKIIQLIVKNSSILDFTIPFYWGIISKYKNIKVVLLYCSIDKRQLIPNNTWYIKNLKKYNIDIIEYDLLNLFECKFFLNNFFRFISKEYNETTPNYFEKKNIINLSLVSKLHRIIIKILFKLSSKYLNLMTHKIDFKGFINRFNPDIFFLDNREDLKFIGSEVIFKSIFNSKKSKVVIPHAPHYSVSEYAFSPVNPHGKEIYDDCDIWLPFQKAKPWISKPDLIKQFFYVGYPGLDTKWLNFCRKSKIQKTQKKLINVFYIGRKFLDFKNSNFVTLDFNTVYSEIFQINKSFVDLNLNYKLIFKIHPSGSFYMAQKLLKKLKIHDYEITIKPIYSHLASTDIVLSTYSTSAIIPAMAGIPTLIFKSKVQAEVNSLWKEIDKLYSNMMYFIEINQIKKTLNQILNNTNNFNDIAHLRKYFPDKSIERCNNRIKKII